MDPQESSTTSDLDDQAPSKKRKLSDSSSQPNELLNSSSVTNNDCPHTAQGSSSSSKPQKKPTILRVRRPVQTSVVFDVWAAILGYCKPDFLFKARTVNRSFNAAITESTWKASLFEEFGPSLPDPPQGLSYQQYANLLTRNSCQACQKKINGKAGRVCWGYQRKYCWECFTRKTRQVSNFIASQCGRLVLIHSSRLVSSLIVCLPLDISLTKRRFSNAFPVSYSIRRETGGSISGVATTLKLPRGQNKTDILYLRDGLILLL